VTPTGAFGAPSHSDSYVDMVEPFVVFSAWYPSRNCTDDSTDDICGMLWARCVDRLRFVPFLGLNFFRKD